VKLVDSSVAIDHLRSAQSAVDLLNRIVGEENPPREEHWNRIRR